MSPATIEEVCAALEEQGYPDLAGRLAYLASDEDLEEGEAPAALTSARAFLAFFSRVQSEGRVNLACSPDGELSAVWRFPDEERRACVWFLDDIRVTFSATDAAGDFIKVAEDKDSGDPDVVMETLVQAGLLHGSRTRFPVRPLIKP